MCDGVGGVLAWLAGSCGIAARSFGTLPGPPGHPHLTVYLSLTARAAVEGLP